MSVNEENKLVFAWGAQRELTDLRGGDEQQEEHHRRQLSAFYGADEPSLNSFVYGAANGGGGGGATGANAASGDVLHRRPPLNGGGAKRALSSFDQSYPRPRARPRARHQPATMPETSFADFADDGSTPSTLDSQPRADSLLHRARRVLSLPASAIRRHPFRSPTAPAMSGGAGSTTPPRSPTPPPPGATRQRSLPRPNFPRSHLAHISRRKDHHQQQQQQVVATAVGVGQTGSSGVAGGAAMSAVHAVKPERVQKLEDELRVQKAIVEKQDRRIRQLEKELAEAKEAMPALKEILSTAMEHFEAKEKALKQSLASALEARAQGRLPLFELDAEVERIQAMSPPTSVSNTNSARTSDTSGVRLL